MRALSSAACARRRPGPVDRRAAGPCRSAVAKLSGMYPRAAPSIVRPRRHLSRRGPDRTIPIEKAAASGERSDRASERIRGAGRCGAQRLLRGGRGLAGTGPAVASRCGHWTTGDPPPAVRPAHACTAPWSGRGRAAVALPPAPAHDPAAAGMGAAGDARIAAMHTRFCRATISCGENQWPAAGCSRSTCGGRLGRMAAFAEVDSCCFFCNTRLERLDGWAHA